MLNKKKMLYIFIEEKYNKNRVCRYTSMHDDALKIHILTSTLL